MRFGSSLLGSARLTSPPSAAVPAHRVPGPSVAVSPRGVSLPRRARFAGPGLAAGLALSLVASPLVAQDLSIVARGDIHEGRSGADAIVFEVRKAGNGSASVEWTTEDVTATGVAQGNCIGVGQADYLASSGDLGFRGNETVKEIIVSVCGDAAYETDETFRVRLLNPSGSTISVAVAEAAILNDDEAPVVLVSTRRVDEGDSGAGPRDIEISLTAASGLPVTVDYSIEASGGGNAASASGSCGDPGADLVPSTGQVTIAPGEQSTTVGAAICGDTEVEPDESFRVALSDPLNAALTGGTVTPNTSPSGSLTIRNDDVYPRPRLSAVDPPLVQRTSPGQILNVAARLDGSAFVPASEVFVGGNRIAATYVSPARLDISIPATAWAAGDHPVTVRTPAPGGGQSETVVFTLKAFDPVVEDPVLRTAVPAAPVVASTSPSSLSVRLGRGGSVTLSGSNLDLLTSAEVVSSGKTISSISASLASGISTSRKLVVSASTRAPIGTYELVVVAGSRRITLPVRLSVVR